MYPARSCVAGATRYVAVNTAGRGTRRSDETTSTGIVASRAPCARNPVWRAANSPGYSLPKSLFPHCPSERARSRPGGGGITIAITQEPPHAASSARARARTPRRRRRRRHRRETPRRAEFNLLRDRRGGWARRHMPTVAHGIYPTNGLSITRSSRAHLMRLAISITRTGHRVRNSLHAHCARFRLVTIEATQTTDTCTWTRHG